MRGAVDKGGGGGQGAAIPQRHIVTLSQCQVLQWAKIKFDELDLKSQGTLKPADLARLTDWVRPPSQCHSVTVSQVWQCYHPAGTPMTPADRAATVKKLMSHVEKRGGELSFDDFAAWFSKTNRQIAKYRAYQVYLVYLPCVAECTACQDKKDREKRALYEGKGNGLADCIYVL